MVCVGGEESSLAPGFWLPKVGSRCWDVPWVPFYSFCLYVRVLVKWLLGPILSP